MLYARRTRVIQPIQKPSVLNYQPLSNQVNRFLLQNFHILTADQQRQDSFPQPAALAEKRDLSLNKHASTSYKQLPH